MIEYLDKQIGNRFISDFRYISQELIILMKEFLNKMP